MSHRWHHRRHHRHHRYGRDPGFLGQSKIAAVLGFLAAPAVVGLASGAVAGAMHQTPSQAATTYAAGHLAGLGLSWWAQKRMPGARSLLRGAMYGEGAVSALAVASAASILPERSTRPEIAAASDLAHKLVEGGFFRGG